MTAYASNERMEEALDEGVLATLTKPLNINSLLNFFSALGREPSLVIVDDDPEFRRTLGDILERRNYAVTLITDPDNLTGAISGNDQIVLLDMKLGTGSGLDVLKTIRRDHRNLPVVLVTGYREDTARAVQAGLRINAYTCLYKPFKVEELLNILSHIQRQELGRLLGKPVEKPGVHVA